MKANLGEMNLEHSSVVKKYYMCTNQREEIQKADAVLCNRDFCEFAEKKCQLIGYFGIAFVIIIDGN
jgi:hypothetical protein